MLVTPLGFLSKPVVSQLGLLATYLLLIVTYVYTHNWGERSEAPHGRYICDFPYIITSVDAGASLGASLRELAAM